MRREDGSGRGSVARLRYCALEVLRRGLYLRCVSLECARPGGIGVVLGVLGRWPKGYLCLKSLGAVRLLADRLVGGRWAVGVARRLSCER